MTQTKALAVRGLSHVALAVPDIALAAAALEKRLGITAGPVEVNAAQGVRLAYIDLGNTRIELIEPTSPNSPLAKFLERNPAGGLHHVSLDVADLDLAISTALEGGARLAGQPGRNVHGDRIAFLNPKDLLGTLVELEENKT